MQPFYLGGKPPRFWHLLPPWGHLNLPRSILAWDAVVLNAYLAVNFVVGPESPLHQQGRGP